MPTIDELRRFDLFSGLPAEELAPISAAVGEETFPAGSRIFGEGDQGDKLYLLADGTVRISKIIHGTGEEALSILKPGAWFGEMALVDDQPRSAEAVADSEAKVYTLSRPVFRQLVESEGRAAASLLAAMVRNLAIRLRETNDQVKAMHLMAMW